MLEAVLLYLYYREDRQNWFVSDLVRNPIGQIFSKRASFISCLLFYRVYKPAALLFSLIIPMYVPHIFWGELLWYGFLGVMVRYCCALHFTWLVNSYAHLYGDRPYDKRINPADTKLVAFFANGEGFHNYHHKFPQDYATGEFGWYYNPTCMFIDLGAYLGQVYDRKTISKDVVLRTKEKYGDGSY